MSRQLALAAAGLVLLAACGSQTVKTTAPAAPTVSVPLASSLVTAQGTWAITEMGDPTSAADSFWEVFVRPATGPGAGTWSLVTPSAVADNGGLVAAGSTTAVQIGFRPSQGLAFSPLATSTDTGKNWTPGVLSAAIADAPDALSLGPSGQELALLANGTIDTATSATGSWTKFTSVSQLAISPAGRGCGLTEVDAMSFWPHGLRVAAGSCERPGVAGVFTDTNGTWQLNGPELAGAYGRDQVRVLRVSGAAAAGGPGQSDAAAGGPGTFSTALLAAGDSWFAAWYGEGRWTVSAPLAGKGARLRASGFGAGASAWVLLGDGRAEVIAGPGGVWQTLPKAPDGTTALAPPAGNNTGYDALAVTGKVLTMWRLTAGVWAKVQVINVPIAYGSSG